MGYSGYIKINEQKIATEYKFQGDVLLTYAKAMLYALPTKLECSNIIQLIEDFRVIDDSISDTDLGLDNKSALYTEIYSSRKYSDPDVVDFIKNKLLAIASARAELSPVYSYLAEKYEAIANGASITLNITTGNNELTLAFTDGFSCKLPKHITVSYPWKKESVPVSTDLSALYDGCTALSVSISLTNSSIVAKLFNSFNYIDAETRNSDLETQLIASLKNVSSFEIYAGY